MKTYFTLLTCFIFCICQSQKITFNLASNPSFKIDYFGAIKNDKANGYGTGTIYKNEKIIANYNGDWKENDITGKGKLAYIESGDTYEGEFLEGLQEGKGIYTWAT